MMNEWPKTSDLTHGLIYRGIFFAGIVFTVGLKPCTNPEVDAKLPSSGFLEFESRPFKNYFNPNHLIENNERNTSAAYTLWDQADVYLLEWPGNITERDPKWPLLKWKKERAQFVESRCARDFLGITISAYAFKYVHLTWGPYRLETSYCPPLRVPSSVVPHFQRETPFATEIDVIDFNFVWDALLIVTAMGNVIRISGLEMTWAVEGGPVSKRKLMYDLSRGLKYPVSKIITQSCCARVDICPFGDTVLAYMEGSSQFALFLSSDGGRNFKLLKPYSPISSPLLHGAIIFPSEGELLIFHGTKAQVRVEAFRVGRLGRIKSKGLMSRLDDLKGKFHLVRVEQEDSILAWDQCSVWYSFDKRNFTKAVFYVHNDFRGARLKHRIKSQHCHFGSNAAVAIGETSKVALLDENNVFLQGIDSATKKFQLVAMKVDMSAIEKVNQFSIVPYFDRDQRPKLLYPPRYLKIPDTKILGITYERRAAMKLLRKTVFPTYYQAPFFKENAHLPKSYSHWGLEQCMTSSLHVNGSITMKSKKYSLTTNKGRLDFKIEFKSNNNCTTQLKYHVQGNSEFVKVDVALESVYQLGVHKNSMYLFSYNVTIQPLNTTNENKVLYVNFYTRKQIRCNIQPQVKVWIILSRRHLKLQDDTYTIREDEAYKEKIITTRKYEYGKITKLQGQGCSSTHATYQGLSNFKNPSALPI